MNFYGDNYFLLLDRAIITFYYTQKLPSFRAPFQLLYKNVNLFLLLSAAFTAGLRPVMWWPLLWRALLVLRGPLAALVVTTLRRFLLWRALVLRRPLLAALVVAAMRGPLLWRALLLAALPALATLIALVAVTLLPATLVTVAAVALLVITAAPAVVATLVVIAAPAVFLQRF